jgi:hypothetical protein
MDCAQPAARTPGGSKVSSLDISSTRPPPLGPRHSAGRDAALALGLAVALRAILLMFDRQPRFFLGDSESYLYTARGVWIPWDRSWLYGFAINALLRATHTLTSLVIVQSLLGAAVCTGVAVLCRAMGVRRWLCAAVLLVASVEPLLLYYDRSVMTETPATLCIWGAVACAAMSLVHPRAGAWLGAVAFFCLGAISLRTALAPLAALVPATLVVLALARRRADPREARRVLGPIALGAVVAAGAAGYATATGELIGSDPALNPRGGYFLLGVTAPILDPADFAGTGVRDPAALLRRTNSSDTRLRNSQVFSPGGIALELEAELGDWRKVSKVGSMASRRAVLRDPLGFARLVLMNTAQYLSPAEHEAAFATQAGIDRPLSPLIVDLLRQRVSEPIAADLPGRPSLALAWLRAASPALPGLVLLAIVVPLVALFATRSGCPRGTSDVVRLLAVATWVHLLTVLALSPLVVPRYLIPLVPFVLALAAITGERLLIAKGAVRRGCCSPRALA